MLTTKQISQLSGVGYSTVRHYAIEWADFLSPSATPEPGATRYFTEEDLAVFKTIKALRDQGAETDQIREVLESGDRYELPDLPPEASDLPQEPFSEPANALAPLGALERLFSPWEDQLRVWQDRVSELEARLQKEQKARARAEAKAHRAENARLKSEKKLELEAAELRAKIQEIEALWKKDQTFLQNLMAQRVEPPAWQFWKR